MLETAFLFTVTNAQMLAQLAFATTGAVEAGVVVASFQKFFGPGGIGGRKEGKFFSDRFCCDSCDKLLFTTKKSNTVKGFSLSQHVTKTALL